MCIYDTVLSVRCLYLLDCNQHCYSLFFWAAAF
jgi:hypothetical protein